MVGKCLLGAAPPIAVVKFREAALLYQAAKSG